MQLTNPITIGEVREVVGLEIKNLSVNHPARSLSVTISMKDADGNEVDTKTFTFTDTADIETVAQDIFDVVDGKISLSCDEIKEATVVNVKTGIPIEFTVSGNEIVLSDQSVERVRIMAKVIRKGKQEFSEIVSGLTVKEDTLWQKIIERISK